MNFDFPQNFFFADSHEFACQEGDLIRIGISAFAVCLLYTSPSPRDVEESRMPSSA